MIHNFGLLKKWLSLSEGRDVQYVEEKKKVETILYSTKNSVLQKKKKKKLDHQVSKYIFFVNTLAIRIKVSGLPYGQMPKKSFMSIFENLHFSTFYFFTLLLLSYLNNIK